jgi:hypothetical protein
MSQWTLFIFKPVDGILSRRFDDGAYGNAPKLTLTMT